MSQATDQIINMSMVLAALGLYFWWLYRLRKRRLIRQTMEKAAPKKTIENNQQHVAQPVSIKDALKDAQIYKDQLKKIRAETISFRPEVLLLTAEFKKFKSMLAKYKPVVDSKALAHIPTYEDLQEETNQMQRILNEFSKKLITLEETLNDYENIFLKAKNEVSQSWISKFKLLMAMSKLKWARIESFIEKSHRNLTIHRKNIEIIQIAINDGHSLGEIIKTIDIQVH